MYDILKEISNLVFIYCIIVLWLIDINKRFSNKEKTFLSLFYTKNIIYKMESTTKSEINEAQKENSDDLEGIIQNEPHKNKYETVRYHKMNQFPYYLIGKVVSKFEIDGVNKFLNGVGILIGPSVVLTVAHNLTHMTQNGEILHTKKVVFFSSSNGDFNLFPPIKSVKTFTPEAYATALKKDEKETQLLNDWGLIFLATPVGNFITSLLDIDRKSELSVDKDNELYKFFSNNQTLKLDSLVSQTNSEKISIVGYTEFKEKYKNNSSYKFLKNFVKKDVTTSEKTDKNSDIKISLSIKKIVSDFVNEIGDDKKINININISEDVNEGLITSSHYYNPNKKKEEGSNVSVNGAEYIVFGEEGYNKEFDVTDAEKQIMSESKGKLVLSDEDREKIKYRLSTYKGQSGSPIFLRYKRISKSKKSDYVYQFVGLHSRRGLSVGTKNFFESEKMSALTENLLTGDVNQEYLGDVYKERIRAKIMNELSKNQLIGDDKNKICVMNLCDFRSPAFMLDKAKKEGYEYVEEYKRPNKVFNKINKEGLCIVSIVTLKTYNSIDIVSSSLKLQTKDNLIETVLEKGIVKYPFLDKDDNVYRKLNDIELKNMEVPKYDELIELSKKLASEINDVKEIEWLFTLTDTKIELLGAGVWNNYLFAQKQIYLNGKDGIYAYYKTKRF